MFSRAHMILDAFDKQAEKNDNEIPQEAEEQEDVVFHTLGNLHQYKGLLLEDTEEDDFETSISKGADALIRDYQPKESYVIHTPEPGDDDYEGLSEVVEELLEENPLICKWR